MPIPPQHPAHVPEKGKDPTSKQFDGDEWIRSLTEAQEITADVPGDCVMYDQQPVDPKKVRPTQMGEFMRKCVSRHFCAQRRRNCSSHDGNAVGSQGGAEALAIFHQLIYDQWASGYVGVSTESGTADRSLPNVTPSAPC